MAPVSRARNNIEWNYIILPCNTFFQNGILCITQLKYSCWKRIGIKCNKIIFKRTRIVAPIISERNQQYKRTIQNLKIICKAEDINTRIYIWQFRLSACNCEFFDYEFSDQLTISDQFSSAKQRRRNIDNCGGRYSYIRVHRL